MGKIIAVVGMAGSGKGTITDHLEKLGYPKVYFGGMVYEEVERRGLTVVEHEREVREDMRKQEGPAVLAKRAAQRADEYFDQGKNTVIFDGLYSWTEYKYLKERYGEALTILAVFTPRAVRYERTVARKEGHRSYTREQIEKRDYEEIENIEKGGPIAIADFTLVNTGTPEDLTDGADAILEQLNAVL